MDAQDFWSEEGFEDTVAAALIACFESKPKKWRGYAPSDRMNEERLLLLRNVGPYIASNSRIVSYSESKGCIAYDLQNDPMPNTGMHAFRPTAGYKCLSDHPNSYMMLHYFRRASALGKYWHRRGAGRIYEVIMASAENDGVDGGRRYVTLSKAGEIVACDQEMPSIRRGNPGERTGSAGGHPEAWLQETAHWAGMAMQIAADRRFCWTISAQEQTARAHLGCMSEEIKSLLYARSLPMTSTGRKRPILHLVEAHKRRMRNGTDVDVTAFLRGQQTVEIGGTQFTVRAPASLRPQLSEASKQRFYAPETASA